MKSTLLALVIATVSSPVFGECVEVKYRDTCVELSKLECTATQSSFVHQVCYDGKSNYMIILINSTRYHYCRIPKEVVAELIHADSVGGFFNASIKGRFGCQGQPLPAY